MTVGTVGKMKTEAHEEGQVVMEKILRGFLSQGRVFEFCYRWVGLRFYVGGLWGGVGTVVH